jgi:hypothetical protein
MKLDLNFPIKGLDGIEIPNTNAGKIIADILAVKVEGISAVKAIDAAIKLFNCKPAELDKEDLQRLKVVIEDERTNLANLVKVPVIAAIDTTINNG